MSSWDEVLSEIQRSEGSLDAARARAVENLATYHDRNVICYYSGWLQGADGYASAITDDDMNGFMNAVYGLDRDKGLDLVLHTPGGDLAATEAIVKYLRDCFGKDICAVVPQLAMSAGTMIACSCKEIIMGRQSSLGPTDPQLGGVAAGGVVEEFERAVQEASDNPASISIWSQIIQKYHPTFLGDCQKAVEMSRELVKGWLVSNMLEGDPDPTATAAKVVDLLCDHKASAMHNRHFSHVDLEGIGLHVSLMEQDNELQDKILTLHHTFMVTFQMTAVAKIIESSNDSKWITSGPQR